MSQSTKSGYWTALKAAGVTFDRHYRDYKTEELKTAYDKLVASAPPGVTIPGITDPPDPDLIPPHSGDMEELKSQIAGLGAMMVKLTSIVMTPQPVAAVPAFRLEPPTPAPTPAPKPKPNDFDPLEHAGVTMNTHAPDEPVRVDESGNQWFRNEVNKPGYAKARGRRVLRAMDEGTITQTIKTKDGYTESFEIPGDPKNAKSIEIKVTLPSFQTGIYKAPGMPFKIHTYQGVRGFDWEDVIRYYGAADLVPSTIKHCYVSSDLCFDIATTIRAIEDEYRERVLKKELTR